MNFEKMVYLYCERIENMCLGNVIMIKFFLFYEVVRRFSVLKEIYFYLLNNKFKGK